MNRFGLVAMLALFALSQVIKSDAKKTPALALLAEQVRADDFLPQDGGKLQVTLIGQPGSELVKRFERHAWLSWFRRSSHWHVVAPDDPRFLDYLSRFVKPADLPCLLVTTPSDGTMRGEVVYFATRAELPSDDETLARQLSAQLKKYEVEKRAETFTPKQFVRHDPQKIYEQATHRQYNPSEPEPELRSPVVPSLDLAVPTDMSLLAAIAAIVCFVYIKKRRG